MDKKPPEPKKLPGQSTEDYELWEIVTRNITPFRKKPPEPIIEVSPPPIIKKPVPLLPVASIAPATLQKKPPGPGLDRSSQEKLRRGKMPIDARLDLHGLPGSSARLAVMEFLSNGYRQGWRCVLIITGKGGKRDGDGILRQSLPHWLEDPAIKALVLSMQPAQPHHGGGGAFYILIRRQRISTN
jgi:DNA-nicking Smr family endonuclease